jgi:hypothetical protein
LCLVRLLEAFRRLELLRAVERFVEVRVARVLFFGTFAPLLRASESPMAIACLRLLTFLPERPLLSLPRLYSCIALLTLRFDVLPYLAMLRLSLT